MHTVYNRQPAFVGHSASLSPSAPWYGTGTGEGQGEGLGDGEGLADDGVGVVGEGEGEGLGDTQWAYGCGLRQQKAAERDRQSTAAHRHRIT